MTDTSTTPAPWWQNRTFFSAAAGFTAATATLIGSLVALREHDPAAAVVWTGIGMALTTYFNSLGNVFARAGGVKAAAEAHAVAAAADAKVSSALGVLTEAAKAADSTAQGSSLAANSAPAPEGKAP